MASGLRLRWTVSELVNDLGVRRLDLQYAVSRGQGDLRLVSGRDRRFHRLRQEAPINDRHRHTRRCAVGRQGGCDDDSTGMHRALLIRRENSNEHVPICVHLGRLSYQVGTERHNKVEYNRGESVSDVGERPILPYG